MEYPHHDLPKFEQKGYDSLYPSCGAHLGSNLAPFSSVPNTIASAIGAASDRSVGRFQGKRLVTSSTARAQSLDTVEELSPGME